MVKKAFQDHHAPSITHVLSERGDEQALRLKSILLTTSRQQQVGQNSDRVKFKGFSPKKNLSSTEVKVIPKPEQILLLNTH